MFGMTEPFTIGVEEEFQIVDPETRDLVSRVDEVLDRAGDDVGTVMGEIFQSVVETATDVCRDVDEVREQVTALREGLVERVDDLGLHLAAAGTHPFARWEEQEITPKERYHAIVEEVGWPAKRDLVFGQHVHVAVREREEAIFVTNGLRHFLPVLLAASTNSPLWRGHDTGLASTRVRIFDAFPRSGMPRAFTGWDEYEATLAALMVGRGERDVTKIWWDVRPRPDLGTVEVRITDACTDVDTAVALAALTQAIVVMLARRRERGESLPATLPPEVVEENRWRALRAGLDATFIHERDDGFGEIPASQAVEDTVELLGDVPEELGVKGEVSHLLDLAARRETGATRQVETLERTGDPKAVVDDLVARTRP